MAGKQGPKSQRQPAKPWDNGNPVEAFKDLASDLRRGLTNDLLKGTANDLLSETAELLGLKPHKKISGTLTPDEILDLTVLEAQQRQESRDTEERIARPETVWRPMAENFVFLQKEKAIEQEIEAILAEIKREIKRLDEATRNLETETTKIVVEEVPPNPGIYHVNFFEWLLGTLRDIRQKIEDAGTWLTALQSKKAKRGYWVMFKKHGTNFGLSSERVVATQTG